MITSMSNPRIKEVVQLQKKSRVRNQMGVFVVEGIRMVREAPPDRLVQVYMTEEFFDRHGAELPEGIVPPELVSPQVFTHISDTRTPQGVLAVVRQKKRQESEILCLDAQGKCSVPVHILILDNLQDPGNVGTIFRTAEAAGVTGIYLSNDSVDIYNPKTIRSTMGAVFRMPFAYVDSVPETIRKLQEQKVQVYAAHLKGKRTYDAEDYTIPTAFLIGNEGNGLRKEVADCADTWIQIPMQGEAESLNAAVAASILMFEVSRQRRKGSPSCPDSRQPLAKAASNRLTAVTVRP